MERMLKATPPETYDFRTLKKLVTGKLQKRVYDKPNPTGFTVIEGLSSGVHHGGPKYIQRLMGITDDLEVLDDIPCIIMPEADHKAFHSILKKYIPTSKGKQNQLRNFLDATYDTQEKKNEYMVIAMKRSYREFAETDNSLEHYITFMDQVEEKLRTKTNISDTLGDITLEIY